MNLALPRFDKGDVLDLDGTLLRLDRQWDDGTLALTRIRSDRPFVLETGEHPTVEWLMTEWATGRLHKKSNKIGPIYGRRKTSAQESAADSTHAEARRVQFILMQLDAWGCSNSRPAVARALDELFTPAVIEKYGLPPSASAVCKWIVTRGTIGNRTLNNCRPKQGQGRRQPRLNEEVRRLRTDAALYWWSAEEVSLEDAHAQHVAWVESYNADRKAHGLEPVHACGIEWLRRRICETQNYDTYAAKFGRPKANAFYVTQGKGVKASRFLEIGIIDHHIFDSYVALEELGNELLPVGRPTVTATYDVKTECIVSAVVSFVPPSLFNMLEAIKQANRPKMAVTSVGSVSGKAEVLASIYGRFDTILPDNAWEFTGSSGQDALQDLGCHIDWSRAGMPKDKAKLERWWGTLTTYLASKLPGAVFNPQLMKELDYDPAQHKVVLASDLRRLLAEAVASYHVKPSEGSRAQPARLWEDELRRWETIPVISDDRQIDQIMGISEEKTLTTAGVKMFGRLQYSHPSNVEAIIGRLASEDGRGRKRRARSRSVRLRVKVKYNPADISNIHVYDHVLKDYVTLECREEFLQGLSKKHFDVLQAWSEMRNLAFNTPTERKLARVALNDEIRKAAPDVAMRHRKRFAALIEKSAGGSSSGNVTVAHVPSSYSGMARVTGHETAVAIRADGGRKPKGPPARKGARVSQVAKSLTAELPHPLTGNVVGFTRGRPKLSAADQDWSGL